MSAERWSLLWLNAAILVMMAALYLLKRASTRKGIRRLSGSRRKYWVPVPRPRAAAEPAPPERDPDLKL
ncbi:MAG: hypothetical protein U1E65_30215 [Myxococcota bacterium]